jgi:hypothetical protein
MAIRKYALTLLSLTMGIAHGALAGEGKLLLTGGVSSIDGAAGGGLTPWALTASYATKGEWGGTGFATGAKTGNYGLRVVGAALAWDDRLELSWAHQRLDTENNLAPLGLPGLTLAQDIVGLKWRIAGDAVLNSDTWAPQVAVGLLHKRAQSNALTPTLTGALGARQSGAEVYACATKLWLSTGVLTNLTFRVTRANQNGLLGHGGQDRRWRVMPEVSLAKLLSPHWAVGLEARAKPSALTNSALGAGALREDDWFDAFVAWAPSKRVSLTAAYVDLGAIAPGVQPKRQRGGYLSLQFSV